MAKSRRCKNGVNKASSRRNYPRKGSCNKKSGPKRSRSRKRSSSRRSRSRGYTRRRSRSRQSRSRSLKPCGPGRRRNSRSNRCREIGYSIGGLPSVNHLIPCGPNKTRQEAIDGSRRCMVDDLDLSSYGWKYADGYSMASRDGRSRSSSRTRNLRDLSHEEFLDLYTKETERRTREGKGSLSPTVSLSRASTASVPKWYSPKVRDAASRSSAGFGTF